MRVLVTTFPGHGHFHPVAPLALALQDAGHDVVVATDPGFGGWVEGCGLRVLPAGLSEPEVARRTAELPPAERAVQAFTTVAVPPFVRDVLAVAPRWPPDLIVSEEGEHAGPLLAAILGVPSVTHSWPAPARPTDERQARERALAQVWRELGQPGAARLYGDRYLDCCPPPLQTDAVAQVDLASFVRPTLFDGPPVAGRPAILDDLRPPVVLVTLGTVPMFSDPGVLGSLAEGAAQVAGTVLVATGPNAADVVAAGPTVRAAAYIPLSAALPVTDVVVSHGGASTAAGCLLSRVPHLVVPQGAPSQHRTASAVATAGLGVALDGRSPDPATVGHAIEVLLDDDAVRHQLEELGRQLDALPGPDAVAVDLAAG